MAVWDEGKGRNWLGDDKVSLLLDYAERPGQSIADPWYTGNFEATYRDIVDGLEGFMYYLRKGGLI